MFDVRELATILAALRFWQEEICPHAAEVSRPYLESVEMIRVEPLTAAEIRQLMERLQAMLPMPGPEAD